MFDEKRSEARVAPQNSTNYFGPIGNETKQDVRSIVEDFGSIKKMRFRGKYNFFAVRFEEKKDAIHESHQETWNKNGRCEWNRVSFRNQILPPGIAGYPAQQAILTYFEMNIRHKCNHFITFFPHPPQNPRRATTLEFTPGFVSINNSKYRHGEMGKVMGPVPKDNEEVVVLVDYMVVSGIQDAIPNWIQIRTNRLKINTPFWIFEEAVSPRLALPIESVTIVDPPAVHPEFPTEMIRTAGFVSLEDTGSTERSLLDILRELPHNSRIQLKIQEGRSFPNTHFIQLIQTWIETPQQIGRRFSVNIRFNWRLQKRIQEAFPMCQKQWIQMSEKKASSRRAIVIDSFHDQRLVVYGRNGRDGVEKHKWTTMEVFPRHF